MLTEKKINHIIDSHVGMTESMTRDLHNAAAAIAKRLSEGVVVSCESVATVTTKSNYGRDRAPTVYIRLSDEMGGWNIILKGKSIGEEPIIPDGQLVEVTVKIVEGTKDGSQGD